MEPMEEMDNILQDDIDDLYTTKVLNCQHINNVEGDFFATSTLSLQENSNFTN